MHEELELLKIAIAKKMKYALLLIVTVSEKVDVIDLESCQQELKYV